MNKDIKQLIRDARKSGARIVISGGTHYKIYGPLGQTTISMSTKFHHHGLKRMKQQIREIGIEI